MKIIVASTNPVKVNAAQEGLAQVWAGKILVMQEVSVESGVSDQPMSEAETRTGALNRVLAAEQHDPSADAWIGIEGGINPIGDEWEAMAWVAIKRAGAIGMARTAGFLLPPDVMQALDEGLELGAAIDRLTGIENSKQKGGAVALLSEGLITRTSLYVPAVILAATNLRWRLR